MIENGNDSTCATLYDWLVKIVGITEGVALDIDDRIPDIEECDSPQALWAHSGFDQRNRPADYDTALLMSVYDFVENLRCLPRPVDDSLYAKIYDRELRRNLAKHQPGPLAIARARRKTAQVFLGHVWEAAYRLEIGHEPPPQFVRPIPPETPYPVAAKASPTPASA